MIVGERERYNFKPTAPEPASAAAGASVGSVWEGRAGVLRAAAGIAFLMLAGCNQAPPLQVPPPPPVTVAKPLRQPVPDFAQFTGQTAAVDSVDLVARVPGFLRSVRFADGTDVAAGQTLFVIEQEPYQAQVSLAQATVEQHQALLKNAEAELERQQILRDQAVGTQANLDKALANRDSERAAVAEAEANLQLARINLGYTEIKAPFAGRIGRHLVDPGNLVGQGAPTKLATIQDIGRIYVNFTASEQDVLRLRRALAGMGLTRTTLDRVPVEAAMQGEAGFPHRGRLDFVDTGLDSASGTIQARAVFDNPSGVLIPGLFMRLRVPLGPPAAALLVPETAVSVDQVGPYLLVVDQNQVVGTRRVTLGPADAGLRAVTGGIADGDQVVIEGLQNASPGRKVTVREGVVRAAMASP